MNLKRTTIIPTDDPNLAKQLFQSFIEKEMLVLMIIIGDTDTIRTAMPTADSLAHKIYFNMERWVLWVRDYEVLRGTLEQKLAESPNTKDMDYDDIKCFSLSPIQDLADGVIQKNGVLDYVSLQQSFFKAQSDDIAFTNNPNT
ncbi:hypothetical protein J1N09_12400 [Aureitalea sp. L0-47]|uniref:hypothetical protein n=1 Tax=Aureitalea sp. L0-47 TaxID=2816962 RepID=UPI002237C376|nr:hypothetical protein [Aureitalea sp. L0-47]MCW5520646.1 hypothetical protein [Aureitalea sp. L0-47]